MADNRKHTAVMDEKNGEDASGQWMLYHGAMCLAYNTISNGTDHDDGKKE